MGKKLKITEDQLKRLVENKDKFQEEPVETTEEVVDLPEEENDENQLNESVKSYKTDFDRYLKGPKQ